MRIASYAAIGCKDFWLGTGFGLFHKCSLTRFRWKRGRLKGRTFRACPELVEGCVGTSALFLSFRSGLQPTRNLLSRLFQWPPGIENPTDEPPNARAANRREATHPSSRRFPPPGGRPLACARNIG